MCVCVCVCVCDGALSGSLSEKRPTQEFVWDVRSSAHAVWAFIGMGFFCCVGTAMCVLRRPLAARRSRRSRCMSSCEATRRARIFHQAQQPKRPAPFLKCPAHRRPKSTSLTSARSHLGKQTAAAHLAHKQLASPQRESCRVVSRTRASFVCEGVLRKLRCAAPRTRA